MDKPSLCMITYIVLPPCLYDRLYINTLTAVNMLKRLWLIWIVLVLCWKIKQIFIRSSPCLWKPSLWVIIQEEERLSLYKSCRAKTHAIIQEEGHLIQKEPGISYIRRAIPNKEISIIYFISYRTHWESYHTNGSRGGLSCTTMAIIK